MLDHPLRFLFASGPHRASLLPLTSLDVALSPRACFLCPLCRACCSRLESVLPQCASLSHTADDVAAYLAQTDSANSGMQQQQQMDKAERQANKTTAAARDEGRTD